MNKDNIKIIISKEKIIAYFDQLPNRLFKILPIYEGRSFEDSTIIYEKNIAYKNYIAYLDILSISIKGASHIFPDDDRFIEILSFINGLKTIDENDHKTVRKIVLKCTRLCTQMFEDIKMEV